MIGGSCIWTVMPPSLWDILPCRQPALALDAIVAFRDNHVGRSPMTSTARNRTVSSESCARVPQGRC
jgi:hypothetical protein